MNLSFWAEKCVLISGEDTEFIPVIVVSSGIKFKF